MPAMPTLRKFTRETIEAMPTGQIGCYVIWSDQVVVYVGMGDIRDRMLKHLNGDNDCITRERPTDWAPVATDDPVETEKRLILELKPICNKRVG